MDAILENDLAVTHKWWDPMLCRWESTHETQIRHRIYFAFTACMPREFSRKLVDGDVIGLYANLISLGGKESAVQIVILLRRLDTTSKIGIPMA